MHRNTWSRLALTAIVALTLGSAPAAVRAGATDEAREVFAPTVEAREVFAPDGSITRVRVPVRPPPSGEDLTASAAAVSGVSAVEVRGPTDTMLDLVFVGDGYTRGELGKFHRDVRSQVALLMSIEPYRNYRRAFNVWAVDVVSAESGVDNDPTPGVMRATALDMEFWCGGTERLLCVDTAKAATAARAAPEGDQVIAIANSTKYGGAGGEVTTAAGANARSAQILMHELGHSIGHLADEYDSAYASSWIGVEPDEPNVTVYPAELMMSQRAKWYRWVGQPSPDGGVVGSYEGARYNPVLYWRPTPDSLMRTLGRPFNSPSREAMVLRFYKYASPITTASPAPGPVERRARIVLRILRPASHVLRVTWQVDGRVVAARGTVLDLGRLRVRPGAHVVAVVEDPTPWVLASPARSDRLRQTMEWSVT
ncbi:MAG: M64 family metallopeptidase [Mycobacteriales bacterium]|nr:M64 family metallopeptidase [Frankia sp.]